MSHPVDVFVGNKLREKRIMLGLSQDAVGKTLGLSFQQIQKYERGVNRISSSRLYEFSKILSAPVGYFFDGIEFQANDNQPAARVAEESSEYKYDEMYSRETLELMRSYYSIKDEKTRRRFADLIRSFAEQEQGNS
jgi:transcriptional regulator with XRE-family HTH domain